MLMLFAPGGFEGFVRATSEAAPGHVLPGPGEGMPDMETLPRHVEEYGAEMLG